MSKKKSSKFNFKNFIKKHPIIFKAISASAVVSILIAFLWNKYIEPRTPANPLNFSEPYVMETAYLMKSESESIRFCQNGCPLFMQVENIDDHEASITNVSIEVSLFEEFDLQTDVYIADVGDDDEYVCYIAPININSPSKAYRFDPATYQKNNIDATIEEAKIYNSTHYEKLTKYETDSMCINMENFPEDGYYTLTVHVTYKMGTKTYNEDIMVPKFLAITDESFNNHVSTDYPEAPFDN